MCVFFRWGCHNCIQCVHRNILMKIIIFEQKLLISFGHWVKKARHFPIFYEVVKTAFCMSKGTIWARDYSCYLFRRLTRNVPVYWRKKLQKFVENPLFMFTRTFWGKICGKKFKSFVKRAKSFGLQAKVFRQVCQNCIPFFQQKNLMEYMPTKD